MATIAGSAPTPRLSAAGSSALVAEPQFQEGVQRSRGLTEKILLAIPDTHSSCVHTETLQLNSSNNAKLVIMASTIGIPSAPLLKMVPQNLETSLRQMYEGLHLHQALLSSVSPQLENKVGVTELIADINDLANQIHKLLKMLQTDTVAQPTPTPVALRLPGEYEVQVAVHLTLVQLQAFGQDMVRCLRTLDRSIDEEAES